MARMNEVGKDTLKVLKHYQHWAIFAGILKLKHELHR